MVCCSPVCLPKSCIASCMCKAADARRLHTDFRNFTPNFKRWVGVAAPVCYRESRPPHRSRNVFGVARVGMCWQTPWDYLFSIGLRPIHRPPTLRVHPILIVHFPIASHTDESTNAPLLYRKPLLPQSHKRTPQKCKPVFFGQTEFVRPLLRRRNVRTRMT